MGLIQYIDIPKELWKGIYQTGSTVICNPPVIDTDEDYIILTKDLKKLHEFLRFHLFDFTSEDKEEYELYGEGFNCYRKGKLNLIVTEDEEFYIKFVRATRLAKKLNLLKKEDRITLFQDILYCADESPEERSYYDC